MDQKVTATAGDAVAVEADSRLSMGKGAPTAQVQSTRGQRLHTLFASSQQSPYPSHALSQ